MPFQHQLLQHEHDFGAVLCKPLDEELLQLPLCPYLCLCHRLQSNNIAR